MASLVELDRSQPLQYEALWHAQLVTDTGEALVEDGTRLLYWPEQALREPKPSTPFEGVGQIRWLAAAVIGDHKHFEADVRYDPLFEGIRSAKIGANAVGEEEVADLLEQIESTMCHKRATRYITNVRQLGSLARSGDFYIGYNVEGAAEFRLARLEDIAATRPAETAGRRYPVPILSDSRSNRGLSPIHTARLRRSLFKAT